MFHKGEWKKKEREKHIKDFFNFSYFGWLTHLNKDNFSVVC